MAETTVQTGYGLMPTYVAAPSGAGAHPGVVVLHDALGLTHDARNQADWLASEGFLAAAPDLFYWGGRAACIRTVVRNMLARRGRIFDEIDSLRGWLAGQPQCSGRVGVIGYCMGGGFALLLAPGHGFAASSVNYGRVPGDVESVLAGACPIVGSFGARDGSLRGAAAKLDHALTVLDVPHDVKEYADAGHSFLNDHDPADVTLLFRVMFKLSGAKYHDPSARDARARIAAFFKTHLASRPGSPVAI